MDGNLVANMIVLAREDGRMSFTSSSNPYCFSMVDYYPVNRWSVHQIPNMGYVKAILAAIFHYSFTPLTINMGSAALFFCTAAALFIQAKPTAGLANISLADGRLGSSWGASFKSKASNMDQPLAA